MQVQCELPRREKHARRTKEHFTLGQGAGFFCVRHQLYVTSYRPPHCTYANTHLGPHIFTFDLSNCVRSWSHLTLR